MKTTKHKLLPRLTAFITMLCMVFTMLPINALAFNPDWYKTHITSVSIGTPTTDLNGKKYLPVTVNFSAEEDIGDSNAVYFLEGYLLATLKNGTKAEGIEGNGMTLMGPLKPDALDGMGSNAYSWNWKGWEEGGGEGVLKYNIPLLEDSDTQTVEQSPYTGQQEVNGLKVGDEVSFKIETVMNTETIPADILPEGGSLMSDEFTVVIEDVSQYPKDITTSGGSCKHDGELAYINQGSKGHDIECEKCNEKIGSESHSFTRHLTGYFDKFDHNAFIGTGANPADIALSDYGEADVCAKCNACINFVAAKDLTKATPAVEEGKAYTQDEAKNIPLKDEKGETVDKNSYTVSVETSKTDENKWVVVFEPVSGKSIGEVSVEVPKACQHDVGTYYRTNGDKTHFIKCVHCDEVLGEEAHGTLEHKTGYFDPSTKMHIMGDAPSFENLVYGEADVCPKCYQYFNFKAKSECSHDNGTYYAINGDKTHFIKCVHCDEVLGEEAHGTLEHKTGYFDPSTKMHIMGDAPSFENLVYGEADVCPKCYQYFNFVAAKDLTKATPAVEEGKAYTQDEAKKITLKDEKGETVDKNSYTVSVEQSETDENKWVVVFEPVSGKSTGKKTIEVKKACEHDGELTYYTKDTKVHCVVCKKCNQELGVQAHEFTVPIDAYLLDGNIYTYPVGSSIKGTAMKCSKCNQCTDFKGPCNHVDADNDEKCDICGADLHQHSYTSKVTKAATCTEEGEMTYTCKCGHSYTEDIPMIDHKYVETVVAPTEDAQGYTLHTCSICGKNYKDNYTDKLHKHSYKSKVTKAATCTKDGVKTFTCECGERYTEAIRATGHKYVKKVVAPTYASQGYTLHTCWVCGKSYKDTYTAKKKRATIAKATISGLKNKYYTGKAIKQTPTVKLGKKTLKAGTDYTVSFKNNKAVGTATVTVTGKGAYTGSVKATFKILPKKTTLKTVTSPKTRQLKATYSKVSGVTGYQVTYSTSSKFTKATTKSVNVKGTSKVISKLTKGKTYYVKVRTYKTVGKTKYYSGYSAVKKIKVK